MARIMTPLASPMKKAISSMQTYLVEVGHITKLDPQDSWLPITESRNGDACYAGFHTLSSGIGFQSLLLPLAFTALGWVLGIVSLCLGFIWQLYTLWLLIQLHESVPGMSYSRYLRRLLGKSWEKILALLPTLYLAGGTCVSLIMIGGETLKIVFHAVCGTTCNSNSLSTSEWYLIFVCTAVILSQLPNLNSIAGVSPIGNDAFESKEPIASANVEWRSHAACFQWQQAVFGHRILIPANGGMLSALDKYHRNDISRTILGLTSLFVVINSLTSFQICAMPVFDNLEFRYTSNKKGPCPWWLRTGLRIFFGCLAFFISVALLFLKDLAGLLGGIALPLTLAYPCLMWIRIKKPQKYTRMWCLNWLLGPPWSCVECFASLWGDMDYSNTRN